MPGRSNRYALRSIIAGALAALTLVGSMAAASAAEARRPLLMEGKQTLFQRILTRPGAQLRAEPTADATTVGGALPAFELFFVYRRQEAENGQWIEVGRRDNGETQGWLPAAQAIDWKQTIVVAFNNPAGRGRALLFDDKDALVDLIRSDDRTARVAALREQALAGRIPPESGVVSIEPETYIDINDQLYILPILDFSSEYIGEYYSQILHVASVPKDREAPRKVAREDALRDFKVGIVFVIDTTVSMGPYIDRTRAAVERIYRRIAESPVGDRTSFGLIGFRDGTRPISEIGYITRNFVPLSPGQQPGQVLNEMNKVGASSVSTKGFTEDSLSAVKAAIESTDWKPFGGRYIVLITDAGPIPANDPNALVRESPAELNSRAVAEQIAIFTLHLKTPNGRPDHASAEAAYRSLSSFQDVDLYRDVPGGSVEAFGEAVDGLADQLIGQISDTIEGRVSEVGGQHNPEAHATALVGRAMQLAYLGRVEQTRAPDLFDAWIADRDVADPSKPVLDVRLLLTKGQLSSMHDVIKSLVDAFEGDREARRNPGELFNRLRSALALMTRTPDRVGTAEFETLGAAFGEFLEGLPYQTSEVLPMTEDDWASIGGARQREIIDSLKRKLAYYEALHNTPELWTALYDGAPDSDHVYPMPINGLP